MDEKVKKLLILLGIFSLSAVGINAWIYFSGQVKISQYAKKEAGLNQQVSSLREKLDSSQKGALQWREKSASIAAALDKLEKEYALLQSKYSSLIQEKDSLAQKNQNLAARLQELDKLYEQAKEKAKLGSSDKFLAALLKEKAQLEVEIKKLKVELSSQEDLSQLKTEKEALAEKLADAQKVSELLSNNLLQEKKKNSALKQQLAEAGSELKLAQTEVTSIELSPIIVKAEAPKAKGARPLLRQASAGRIIAVNENHDFVVIDLGKDDGLQEGMQLEVYRQNEKAGRIKVIEARQNISACDIREMRLQRFKVNDIVRR